MKNLSCHVVRLAMAFILPLFLSIRVSAQRIDSLYVPDTRSIASVPGNYSRSLKVNFKFNNVIGLSSAENYAAVLGLRAWTADNSGGKAFELAFTSDNVFLRSGYTEGWGSWKRLLTDENIKESSGGNVGIGIPDPQSKLAVNGTVTAKQVKVTQTGWPDYVFDSAYRLPDLSETEIFIKKNSRLPGMPSAKEVETNGLDLGEMQKKQMKQFEELTLLLIRQQHEIDSLKSVIRDKLITKEDLKSIK